ncbi:hypothetical protein [Acinetobacter phage ABPH49]|nr:hypothetical protein [Acinetobacter phage ABPH49]
MNEGLRDLFEEAVMEKINISKKTLVGMRTNSGTETPPSRGLTTT